MFKSKVLILILIFILSLTISCFKKESNIAIKSDPPKRVILFISDAMPVGAPERIPLPVFESLKDEGCYFKEVHVSLAAHPKRNENVNEETYYPWGCSLPNPVAMTGTVFIGWPDIKQHMIQHSFKDKTTAFTVNCDSYEEISPGYTIYHQLAKNGFPDLFRDELPVEDAMKIIQDEDPAFIRIHLQGPGSAGHIVFQGTESYNNAHMKYAEKDGSIPWYKNIWYKNSPYIQQALYADSLLGSFINWLKQSGRWEDSILLVMGDHGQWDKGTHPPYAVKSSVTPLVIAGKGIKKGKRFETAEILDLVPTLAFISNVPKPKYAIGRVLKETMVGGPEEIKSDHWLVKLNQLLIAHHEWLLNEELHLQDSEALKALNDQFKTIETIGIWHRDFNTLESLYKHNKQIFDAMKELMK